MSLTVAPSKSHSKKHRGPATLLPKNAPLYAAKEINAYIAIRDQLLVEAEKARTTAKLDSVVIANDFVAGCLKPARSPYEMQCLPDGIAQRERQRCATVTDRVAVLRTSAA